MTPKINDAVDGAANAVPAQLRDEVAHLVERAQVDGIQLTGEGGLLPDMIKQAVEAALHGEMTAHLGYERYAAEGRGAAIPATVRRRRRCRPLPGRPRSRCHATATARSSRSRCRRAAAGAPSSTTWSSPSTPRA